MTLNVLIVDDSKLARMAVAKALNALRPEWRRVEASNADEALQLASEGRVDVALLDFNMPGRDGLELAEALRSIDPAMALAVVSANHQDEIVARAREIGASFLPKPVSTTSLQAFLDAAVSQ